jgi:hypothetical protein
MKKGTFLSSFYEANIIPIQKPAQENYKPISLLNTDAETLYRILYQIQSSCIEKRDQVGLSLEM